MALGIYKPGQGYWMRVLTAAVVGAIFLALAMWTSQQVANFIVGLPYSSYSVALRPSGNDAANAASALAPGTRVTTLGDIGNALEAPVVGTAIVESYDAENRIVVLNNTTFDASTAGSIRQVRVDSSGDAPYIAQTVDTPVGRRPVEPVLVQSIVASVIVLIGAAVVYWFCALRPSSVDFLINTDMEMKKVNWSTRKDITGSTWVVISFAVIIAAFIFFADFVMQALFRSIGVLQG